MKIPRDNIWTQTNDGDFFGVLSEVENMNFANKGKMQASRKPFSLYTSDDNGDLGYILSIDYFDGNYICLTNDEAFTFDLQAATLTEISSSPVFGLNSDAEVFNSRYYTTTNNDISYWNGSSWTNSLKSLTSNVPHPLASFDSESSLAIGNGNQVILINTSHTTTVTLTIPSKYQVTTMRYRNGYLYIGTKNLNGGEAKVFIWSASTSGSDYEVPIGSNWVFSMTEYGNSVACVTNAGELLQISGSQSNLLAIFPIAHDTNAVWADSSGLTLNGKVMNRGMITHGSSIYLNVDATTSTIFNPKMKSGIWQYSPDNGLHHRSHHSLDKSVSDNGLSVSNSVITTSTAHNLKTGDGVVFSTTSGLSGIDTQVTYYAKVNSSTQIRLSLTRKALRNENYVEITGTPTSLDVLEYVENTDFNASYGGAQGAIGMVSSLEKSFPIWTSPIIWGARMDDKDGNSKYGILTFVDSYNISRFTLQRLYASEGKQTWESLYTFLDGITNSEEEIILKAITEDNEHLVLQGVWGSTNKIHSVASSFDEDEWSDVERGCEVVLIDGYGRGYSAHVTKIETSSNTFVLTLDESVGTVNKPVYFYYTMAKKIGDSDMFRCDDWSKTKINEKSNWIKITGEMRGFEPAITHFDVVNAKHQGTV